MYFHITYGPAFYLRYTAFADGTRRLIAKPGYISWESRALWPFGIPSEAFGGGFWGQRRC